MGSLKDQFWKFYYRAQIAADVPMIARVLRYRKVRELYYKQYWENVAADIGAKISPWPGGHYIISKDGKSTLVKQSQLMLDSQLLLHVLGNKHLTNRLITECGLRSIDYQAFMASDIAKAVSFLESQDGSVVVKPMSGTGGGRGVTTGIANIADLKRAARLAARFDHELLIEKQIGGSSFRLLYLDGKLIDAVRRDPPVVHGDGKSTVRLLVKIENQARVKAPPFRALSPLVIDADCKNWMSHNKIQLASVPATGETVQVKRAINENDSTCNVNVLSDVSDEINITCMTLVKKIGVEFAGVDLMCHDISGPYDTENCTIGEINTAPGLHHHDLISQREQIVPVGQIVLEHMFSQDTGVMHLEPE